MSLTDATEAFVILSKPAPEGHRLAANHLGVRLFSEKLFDAFAESTAKEYLIPNSYLEQAVAWEALLRIGSDYPALKDHLTHLSSTALLQTNAATGLRSMMARLKKAHGELDPTKAVHRAVFLWTVSQTLFFLSDMTREFHSSFDPDIDEEKFTRSLRHYVWGGRESYSLRKRLNEALQTKRGEGNRDPFEFPAWKHFVEMFRALLDAPILVGTACLPIKDMAFRELTPPKPELDVQLAKRIRSNNRLRQFVLLTGAYLVDAAGLPKEFSKELEQKLIAISA